jgi:hypothetical protein
MARSGRLAALSIAIILLSFATPPPAAGIDFYEIQIYPTETTPQGHFQLELHSNTVSSATGEEARKALNPYQIHETFEGTYGVLSWLEVGQYFATARLNRGDYEYAGSRTKVHFGVPQTAEWPVRFGGNIEFDYMRFGAEENPMTLEFRPIVETDFHQFELVADFIFVKPLSGRGAHQGFQFAPSGEILYELSQWLSPREKARTEPRRGLRYYSREQRGVFQVDRWMDVLISSAIRASGQQHRD